MNNVFRLAFLAALEESGTTANAISQTKSDMTNLSKYRQGRRDFTSAILSRYFLSMPPEAQEKFLGKLAGYIHLENVTSSQPTLTDIVNLMDANSPEDRREAAKAIRLIVKKFLVEPTSVGESTDTQDIEETIECKAPQPT